MVRRCVLYGALGMVFLAMLLVVSGCDTENPVLTYHSIVFNRNGSTGGTVPVFAITAPIGSTVVVPDNTGNLVKEDHLFIGWNTEADGSGNYFYPDDTLSMPAGNVVLYAAWERLYLVGETGPAGGIVFYDKGSRIDGWRYLEAAPVATEWLDRIWGEQFALDIEGTSDAIGAGKANTQLIFDAYGDANSRDYAASLCEYLEYGGFHDWFLPSLLELNEMYEKLHMYSLGTFGNDYYWSSTANISAVNDAYIVYFATGQPLTSTTYNLRHVRAIRSF